MSRYTCSGLELSVKGQRPHEADKSEVSSVARGFLSGVIMGTLVAGVGAGALSLATDLPTGKAPVTGAVAPEATKVAEALPAAMPTVTSEESAPVMGDTPSATAPETDSISSPDTQAAAKPEAGVASADLSVPDAGVAPVVSSIMDEPVAGLSLIHI